jgi:lipopolysaccharide transport system ATP-binding protein
MTEVLRVEGLGKRYRLQHTERNDDPILPDTLADSIRSSLRKLISPRSHGHVTRTYEDFWALKDVSFTINQGDRVGMIGRNGAGKSTLLKILSRVTEPTTGRIALTGRVASLLEVGTGFHPELSGRENIFLNGAILGMTRPEIQRKFDEIVEFSEVDRFLDTPVKRYSSGMYVRLAFAVAAHMEPEMLIVDEVLAVGDAQFQKKCLNKMQDIAANGCTIIFISHSMATISNLCTKCMYLESGRMLYYGDTDNAIEFYISSGTVLGEVAPKLITEFRPAWAKPLITSATLLDDDRRPATKFLMSSPITIRMEFEAPRGEGLKDPSMGVVFHHNSFGPVGGVNMAMTGTHQFGNYSEGCIECRLPNLQLLPGQYSLEITLSDGSSDLDNLNRYLRFTVEESDIYGTGKTPVPGLGVIYLEPEWTVEDRMLV